MGSHNRAQTVVGVSNSGGPLPHRLGYRVFQCSCSCCHRNDFCAEQTHPVHVQRLPAGIFLSHKYHALHAHQRRGSGSGDAMLSCSCLRDQTGFPHLLRQERLPQHVIDLVRARVVQIFPFQIDLRAAQIFCHLLRIIESRRSSRILIEQFCQFPVEFRVIFIMVIRFFQFNYRIHQCLRDILPAVNAKASVWIRHHCSSFLTAAAKAAIFLLSFFPSVSMPELTSTP